MVDLAFFDTPERTEYSDEIYAVIGRALTVATHYETNCKALANTMNIRENVELMEDSERFQGMLEKLAKWQLKRSIDKFTSTIRTGLQNQGLSDELVKAFEETIFKWLEEGRTSRNFIIHELTLGIAYSAETNEFREKTVPVIKEHIEKVAKADFYIASFIERCVNKMNISPGLEDYINRVVNWVCKIS